MKGLAPSAATRADLSGSSRGSPADALGDLRVTVRASPPGTPPRTSYSSRSEHPVRFLGDFAGLSHGAPSISFGAPSIDRMSIAASGDGFTSSEDEGAVGLPPSGVVATAAPGPELTAMLARAAVSIGLEVNRPPSPEPSRLDDWFLGAGRGSQPRPAPVPFFPEVHEELTSSWMAPFTARSRSSASSVLTTLDGGVARGYAGIPQVERAVAVHLCPRNAATWRNRPRLPSKACKLTAALAAKAYSAAGQAASALHAMAILQVHQAKVLKQVHEGSTDPGLMQELRTATDFALRATKVTARSLGKAMSTMVVQERHLWLNLAEMKDVDKARFLDAPISQGGLQTEAIQHILPRRDAPSTAALGARPQSARRRGRPPASSRAAPPQAESTHRPARRASRRRAAPPAGNPEMLEFALSQETARTAPLLPPVEGREENLLFRFVSVPPLVQGPAVPTFSKKEQFPFPPGSQVHGTTVCNALPPHSRPRPILPVAKRIRFGDDIPPHAPLASPVRDPGSSVRMPQNAPPSVPSTPTPFRCTTTGTSIVPLEPLAQRLEAWLTLPSLSRWLTRTIRLGYAIQFARRPPKFNGVLETSVAVRNAPVLREEIAVLLAKDAIEPVPPAEMRQGFYSPYFIVPKKGGGLRPILDLRVLNRALHKLPFKMLTHRRMIKCIQPQDWFAAIDLKDAYFHVSILPRHRPFLRFAFEGRAWQYRVLPFGLSLSPRVFTKVVEGALTPLREVGVRILNYLDDWLILAQSREQLGDHRDLVLRHLSQLGLRVNWEKSKLSPVQRISFLDVSLAAVPATAVGQARASPHGQHCGGLVYQPAGGYTITPHVTARPPSPPLESHAVQVTACCSHPGAAQSCGRRALTTAHVPRRMATPSRDDPADLESIRGSSGRPVCLPRVLPLPAVLLPDRGPPVRSLFATWCSSRREDPRRCTIGVVLSFLQERLERRLSPSTLKVYVAAIAAHHDAVDGRSLGKHDLIVRFLKGARRMNPSRPPLVPSWDLSIVLAGFQRGPFEPLDSVELKFLSLKTALLTTLTSIKRVGDLQAFSVSEECLVFGPFYSHVVLRPRPGYVPKVPTTPFCDQVVNLQALPSEEADPALALLCPVRALRIYVTRTRSVRSSEQLFVCHGGQQKGKAVSKQRLAHWIVEAVALAYQSQGEPCPLGVRAHSTRSVASSHALAHGASLADICRAAGWATPNTFARFYNLCVEPVSSRVLGK